MATPTLVFRDKHSHDVPTRTTAVMSEVSIAIWRGNYAPLEKYGAVTYITDEALSADGGFLQTVVLNENHNKIRKAVDERLSGPLRHFGNVAVDDRFTYIYPEDIYNPRAKGV